MKNGNSTKQQKMPDYQNGHIKRAKTWITVGIFGPKLARINPIGTFRSSGKIVPEALIQGRRKSYPESRTRACWNFWTSYRIRTVQKVNLSSEPIWSQIIWGIEGHISNTNVVHIDVDDKIQWFAKDWHILCVLETSKMCQSLAKPSW